MTWMGAYIELTDHSQPPAATDTENDHLTLLIFKNDDPSAQVAAPAGVSYDKRSNTLTLSGYENPSMSIWADSMGDDFSIKVVGKNSVRDITAYADTAWGCGLSITGNGSLDVNAGKNEGDAVRVRGAGDYCD